MTDQNHERERVDSRVRFIPVFETGDKEKVFPIMISRRISPSGLKGSELDVDAGFLRQYRLREKNSG